MCDYPTLYKEQIRTARKPYKCYECGVKIEPGKQYEHITGIWDGRFESFKICLFCSIAKATWFIDYYDCVPFGDLWDTLYETDIAWPIFWKNLGPYAKFGGGG